MNTSPNIVEFLEKRLLCAVHAAQIVSDYLDSRGEAVFTLSVALNPSTLSRKTAAIYTAGADTVLGTADDVRNTTNVTYRKGVLTLLANLPLNTRYRVKLNSSVIQDVNGRFLDGEFRGDLQTSGNGHSGGDYDVISQPAVKTRAHFTTTLGSIDVGFYRNTPITKQNFITYTNAGDYDSTVIHRSIKVGIDIIQGGGFTIDTAANTTGTVTSRGNIVNEATNLNEKGTIAMANAGANTNSSQWFFNVNSNTGLDQPPGTYTVFGGILDDASQKALNAILALDTSGSQGHYPLAGQTSNTDVPVLSVAAINARSGSGPLVASPKDDLVIISRIAMLMDVAAPPGSARPAAALSQAVMTPSTAPAPVASPFLAIKDQKDSLLD